ncbi:MAG: hypothetical protein K5785_00950 [Nitrosarchaeum sp.]|nr:hypothetical protein [Nitrosarchaeum sp.]
MAETKSGTNESAQKAELQHKKFLQKFDAELKKHNVPKSEHDELMKKAREMKPGDAKALSELKKEFESIVEEIAEDAKQKEFDDITSSTDFKEFVVFAKATQVMPADADIEDLSEGEQSDILLKFRQWVKKGKPAAVNPLAGEEPERILRVTRLKAYGRQKLTAIISGQAIPMGVELIPNYAKFKENGKEIVDKSRILSHTRKYTIDYTERLARELVKRCEKESETPQFTFKEGGRTVYIHDVNNFFRDFDEVMREDRMGSRV